MIIVFSSDSDITLMVVAAQNYELSMNINDLYIMHVR